MKIDGIKKELAEIITNLKTQISEEEKSDVKTANYKLLKERLAEAEEFEADISEAEKNGDSETEIFEFRLSDIKMPLE